MSFVCAVAAKNLADYHIGDRAEEDIVTPVRLVVVDPEATDQLKENERERIPAVFRYFPHAGDEAVAAFQSTFAKTRNDFLDALESEFHIRTFAPEDTMSESFTNFVKRFQKQNVLFPVSISLAQSWAAGESSDDAESALVARLRETMKQFVRSEDPAPSEAKVGSMARIVTYAETEKLTPELVSERGSTIHKTDFISLPRAKQNLEAKFPDADHDVGKYLASFVKPNCFLEVTLTASMRDKHTEGLVETDHYKANDVLVHKGDVITEKIKAALVVLDQMVPEKKPAEIAVAPATPPPTNQDNRQMQWLMGLLAAALFVLALTVWRLTRRRDGNGLLPARVDAGMFPAKQLGETEDAWRERALLAEQRVQKAQAAARSGLLAHLSQWMSDKLTQRLVSERDELMDAHQKAALEMASLEARLEKIQAPLQDRLRAYEQRIQELEKELAVKGEENRELIKAKIRVVQKQLEIERARNRLEYN